MARRTTKPKTRKPKTPVYDTTEHVPCVNDNRKALLLTYKDGGVPRCSQCWKKENARVDRLVEKNNKTKGKIGGTRGVFLPKSVVEMYEESILDAELVSVREDIATFEARIKHLLGQIKEDPRNSVNWATVLDKQLKMHKKAIDRGAQTYKQAFESVLDFMSSPIKEKLVWSEVYAVSELKRRAVATESKRLNDLGWSPEMVMAMFAEVANLVQPLMTEANLRRFMESMATSRLFNNQQFALMDQTNLTARTVDQQLFAQEIHETSKDPTGAYVVKSTMSEKDKELEDESTELPADG